MDGSLFVPSDGGRTNDVRPPGDGHRSRPGGRSAWPLPATGPVGRVPAAGGCQYLQHCGGSGRNGRFHAAGDRHLRAVLDALLRGCDHIVLVLVLLCADSPDFQMADAGSVCLCDRCISSETGLERGSHSDAHTAPGMVGPVFRSPGRNLRNHHFAVFVFLAGVTRSRGGTRSRPDYFSSEERGHHRRVAAFAKRHHHRNVLFEPGDVLHNPDHCRHLAYARKNAHCYRARSG